MSYTFVKLASYYRSFLDNYYSGNPGVIDLDYDQQYRHIMDQCFSWSNYFQKNLQNLQVNAHEIVFNCEALQKAWAKKYGIEYNSDMIISQLRILKPDVVFFQDTHTFNSDFIRKIREEVKCIKIIIGHCCSPYSSDHLKTLKEFDFILSCSPRFTKAFNEYGINNLSFYHSFEHTLLPKLSENNSFENRDMLFIGSFQRIYESDYHDERLKLICSIIDNNLPLTVFANLEIESSIQVFIRQIAYVVSKSMKKTGFKKWVSRFEKLNKSAMQKSMPRRNKYPDSFLKHVINKPLFGLEMYKAMYKSKIGFNSHGGIAGNYAANVRMFEVTGCGSLLITDNKKNMPELFVPDKEVIVYNSPEECIEKIKWLINNPSVMKEIALNGQKRTLKDHTMEKRIFSMHQKILQLI